MERIVRPVEMGKYEEELLLHPPPVNHPRVVATREQQIRQLIALGCKIGAAAVALVVVWFALFQPTVVGTLHAQAMLVQGSAAQQIAQEGRMVRNEEEVKGVQIEIGDLKAKLAEQQADIKSMAKDINSLGSELDGAQKLMKLGGILIAGLTGLSAWFSKNPRKSSVGH